MELLVFVAASFILAVLAMRSGQDSRPTADSQEQAWADLGMHHELASPAPAPAPVKLSGVTQLSLDGV
jgi:hypothetical protein